MVEFQHNLILHKSGAYLREGTHDKYVPGQIGSYKPLVPYINGNVVLDIGGHIGLFARFALDNHADRVISIEPHPYNCILFEINTLLYDEINIELYDCAVVNSYCDEQYMTLYESSTDSSAHSLIETRGRGLIEVETIPIEDLLHIYEPYVVKIDIEGYEYELLHDIVDLFPFYGVGAFAAELHLNRKDWRDRGREFVDVIEDNGWVPIKAAKIGEKNWNTTGVWIYGSTDKE